MWDLSAGRWHPGLGLLHIGGYDMVHGQYMKEQPAHKKALAYQTSNMQGV